ncbi:hypothetical protein [Oceanicaulis sp. UBA2681]|uniref:hypothetical protein n=1 Tax=Oceanicaulis sp. UBA2681 TaxID=1947007 RepID=UPI00257C7066|nr:hypothetical protein [Oceanicaulis sp. UBA2681]
MSWPRDWSKYARRGRGACGEDFLWRASSRQSNHDASFGYRREVIQPCEVGRKRRLSSHSEWRKLDEQLGRIGEVSDYNAATMAVLVFSMGVFVISMVAIAMTMVVRAMAVPAIFVIMCLAGTIAAGEEAGEKSGQKQKVAAHHSVSARRA